MVPGLQEQVANGILQLQAARSSDFVEFIRFLKRIARGYGNFMTLTSIGGCCDCE